jgi:D-serine deaminase-like pyridoxal phosphate-dependent protein
MTLDSVTAHIDPPFAAVELECFDANLEDLLRRAGGKPVRLASKSVRCRALMDRALRGGMKGILAFTLPEALWLAELGYEDIVVGYPTVDRSAIARLPHPRVTVMVDSPAHLELLPAETKVCIDIDAGWRALGGRIAVGAKRSPLRTPAHAAALARMALERDLVVDGVMAYEAQIAGVGDSPPGRPLYGRAIRMMQRLSARELASRRAAVVAAVRAVAPDLRFVNGGGTGSVETTAREDAVTEVAAGSGLFAPTLFDAYSGFSPRPAAFFCLPVVRKPSADVATVLGGGYLASGPGTRDRLPQPVGPFKLDPQEGAGEVQTPLHGAAALQVGDRAWFRHAKAGELCERFDALWLVKGELVTGSVPTYRGEGRCFL